MTGKAIYALLSANATLVTAVSTRIFPDMATQEADYPFLIYTVTGTDPSDSKDGVSGLDAVQVSVTTFATTYTQAVDVSELVRTALDRKTGTYQGVTVQSIRFVDQRSAAMDWDKHIFIIEQDYSVRQVR